MPRSELIDQLAAALEETLTELYGGRIGFALFMFPFGELAGRAGDYVSNAERAPMIKFMREIADRLETGQDIPRTIGSA